jgi:hypothetical protein
MQSLTSAAVDQRHRLWRSPKPVEGQLDHSFRPIVRENGECKVDVTDTNEFPASGI